MRLGSAGIKWGSTFVVLSMEVGIDIYFQLEVFLGFMMLPWYQVTCIYLHDVLCHQHGSDESPRKYGALVTAYAMYNIEPFSS